MATIITRRPFVSRPVFIARIIEAEDALVTRHNELIFKARQMMAVLSYVGGYSSKVDKKRLVADNVYCEKVVTLLEQRIKTSKKLRLFVEMQQAI